MAEYIEREGFMKAIMEDMQPFTVSMVARHIREYPAADVVEVRHGRLEKVRSGDWTSVYQCSECGRRFCVAGDRDKTDGFAKEKYPYCNCGAKMDGGAE